VGVRFIAGRVEVGDQLLVLGSDGAYKANVVSIRNFGTSLTNAHFEQYPELGLGLDVDVGKGARLVAFHKLVPSGAPDKSQTIVSQDEGRFRIFVSAIRQAFRTLVDPTSVTTKNE
jgi:sulfate adenylyltransferase subunit 1 (EFTu-like GTPase family)